MKDVEIILSRYYYLGYKIFFLKIKFVLKNEFFFSFLSFQISIRPLKTHSKSIRLLECIFVLKTWLPSVFNCKNDIFEGFREFSGGKHI